MVVNSVLAQPGKRLSWRLLGGALTALVFVLDLRSPPALSVGACYVVVQAAVSRSGSRRLVRVFSGIVLVLIALDLLLSQGPTVSWTGQLLSAVAVATVFLVLDRQGSYRLLESIVDGAQNGLLVVNRAGSIVRSNRRACEVFGYDDLTGVSVHALVPQATRPAHPDLVASYFRDPRSRMLGPGSRDLEGVRRDGSRRTLQIGLSPVRTEESVLALASVVDVTEWRQAEAEAVRLSDELLRSNRELDAFASIASHDLREPLRGLRTYSQILLEEHGPALGESGAELCQSLVKLSARMDQLIESLRRYARVGRGDLSREPVDLGAAADEAKALMQIALDESAVQLVIADGLPTVSADRTLVIELLGNLIQNAIKYNDKVERKISIQAVLQGGAYVVSVSDNGIGIDAAHQETVFQMFKRLHPRAAFGGGSGAGLTIAKKIVEKHGGRIWIDSVVGQGTTIHFTLAPEEGPDGSR